MRPDGAGNPRPVGIHRLAGRLRPIWTTDNGRTEARINGGKDAITEGSQPGLDTNKRPQIG